MTVSFVENKATKALVKFYREQGRDDIAEEVLSLSLAVDKWSELVSEVTRKKDLSLARIYNGDVRSFSELSLLRDSNPTKLVYLRACYNFGLITWDEYMSQRSKAIRGRGLLWK